MALAPRLLWLHGCVGIDGPDHRDPIAQVSYGEGHDANLGVGKVQPDVLRQIGQQLGVAFRGEAAGGNRVTLELKGKAERLTAFILR